MFYTYILQCEKESTRHYIGSTDDLKRRLAEQNAGKCSHTAKYRPWKLKSYFAFECAGVARAGQVKSPFRKPLVLPSEMNFS
jgi:putative endonuclease